MQPEAIEISNDDVVLAVEKKLEHGNFRILSQYMDPVEDKIGMLGDHAFLNVTVLNNVKKQETVVSFFVKLFPKQETLATFASGSGAFQKEEFSYELFKKFEKYTGGMISKCVPHCYITKPNEYMILDDLSDEEYYMPDKMEFLDYDTILVVLRFLAQFHACSIIFEERMCAELDKTFRLFTGSEKLLKDTLYYNGKDFINKDAADSTFKCILTEIEIFQFPKMLASGKTALDATKEIYPRVFELVKPAKAYRNVLCHGDLWASNLMFKNDKKGKVACCKFVDFQCVRYVPPSHDVLSLIYLATSREFRKNHLYELLGIYYTYLEKILKISGCSIEKIIPFSDYLESCEEQKLFAILQAAGIIPLILSRKDSLETYFSDKELYQKVFRDDRSVLIIDNEDNEQFMVRAKESIEDLLEECEKLR